MYARLLFVSAQCALLFPQFKDLGEVLEDIVFMGDDEQGLASLMDSLE